MRRAYFLLATALIEGGAGLLLLALPSLPFALLLGVSEAAPEAVLVGRVAGAALLAIAIACWPARGEGQGPARRGVLAGVLVYDGAAALLLGYAGLALGMAGIVLWPAVVLHTAMAVWCVACLRGDPRGGPAG
jgi:hypothetical protein